MHTSVELKPETVDVSEVTTNTTHHN